MEPDVRHGVARAARPLPGTAIAAHDPIDIAAGTEVCLSFTHHTEATITGTPIGTTCRSATSARPFRQSAMR